MSEYKMRFRILGKTGYQVSEIGFGAWAIGADWGKVTDKDAMKALNQAVDSGVNFFDTADVYGDGRSEKLIAKLKKSRDEKIYVATKAGRRLNPHVAEGYTKKALNEFVDRSLTNLEMDTLDLLQLHCPPTSVYYNPSVFEALDEMKKAGKIRHYGVSVEKVEEALKAIEYPEVSTIQIIFNMFRQRPAELFFRQAIKKDIGVIVRVPLASGLLTGKMTSKSKFGKDDHRNYNNKGQKFDVGETFAGVPFEIGVKAAEDLKKVKSERYTMPQFALKWILMHNAVTTVIPGGKNAAQVKENSDTSEIQDLSGDMMHGVRQVYKSGIQQQVHHLW